jgi:hypothetical protein
VISNSAALTPCVPGWSRIKLAVAPFLVEKLLGISPMNPNRDDDPFLSRGKIVSKLVSLFHKECDVPACHILSLFRGTGWPALYRHENPEDVTHRHVRKTIASRNTAVKYRKGDPKYAALPDD